MKQSIDEGLSKTGVLPGGLNVQRKAKYLYEQHPDDENPAMKEFQMIAAYAYAVAEQNADNGTIVTAPTCGSAGVLPAVLLYKNRDMALYDRLYHLRNHVDDVGNNRLQRLVPRAF